MTRPKTGGPVRAGERSALPRRWQLLALALALAVAISAILHSARSARKAPVVTLAHEKEPNTRTERPRTPEPSSLPPRAKQASFIRAIHLEKDHLCVGETSGVSVAADDPEHEDDALLYRINGQMGNPGLVAFESAGTYTVGVEVFKSGEAPTIERRNVQVRVDECSDDHSTLVVSHEYLAELAIHAFVAKPSISRHASEPPTTTAPNLAPPSPAPSLAVASKYTWDFGDGTKLETAGPYAEHAFKPPHGRTVMHTYRVSVAAMAEGRALHGLTQVSFQDLYAVNRRRGVLAPEAKLEALESSGTDRLARIRVSNPESYALRLDRVTVRAVPCFGSEPAEDRADTVSSAFESLSTQWLESGDNLLALRLRNGEIRDGTCIAQVTLSGAAREERMPVVIELAIVLKEPDPLRRFPAQPEPSSALDVERVSLLDRALTLLGRKKDGTASISQEELAQLKLQGRL